MNTAVRTCILLCLFVVASTYARGQCNNNSICIEFEQCTGLYSQLAHTPLTKDEVALLQRMHCGHTGMKVKVCCPPGLAYI